MAKRSRDRFGSLKPRCKVCYRYGTSNGKGRKDGMTWVGIRAYHHGEGYWMVGNQREESATVVAWKNLEEPFSPIPHSCDPRRHAVRKYKCEVWYGDQHVGYYFIRAGNPAAARIRAKVGAEKLIRVKNLRRDDDWLRARATPGDTP